ncbi:hypothetical protein BDV59DRAFT_176035 [Aspergillus ambiguus]|uniref:uncharacterized protein n=1 Tax=Aspergillus ambiguus TaxID=176160 RepID=UPI003CCD833E
MPSPFKTGYFQTFEYPSQQEVIIHDDLYGNHLISEPVLVDLLQSPALLRLEGVCQHGVTGFLGITHRITRLEHSVGAFLMVRSVGASIEEQIAALLHDISHTTLSHVVDWALSKHGEESFHEVHKHRYVNSMTNLPSVLEAHGFGESQTLEEHFFPLVEQPSPHLCADRLDYALRDAVGFNYMSLDDARQVLSSLKAFPDAFHPQRIFVLQDADLSVRLARAYIAIDRDVWSNPAHIDMYRRTGQAIATVIRQGSIKEEQLWELSDREFWDLMRNRADKRTREVLDHLESEGLPPEDGLPLPHSAKVRTLDPDIYVQDAEEPLPLSVVLPSWAAELQKYIHSREVTRG